MISTGINYLDKLLGGGFPENTVILISGEPGAGKTLFCMTFLMDGVSKGEKSCYVTLMENKSELLRACGGFETLKKAESHIGRNFAIQEVGLTDKLSKDGKFNLEQFVKLFDKYPKIDRVVIDNVNKLLIYAKDEKEYRMHLSDLICELKKRFACSLIICEAPGENIDSGNGESFECDGVIKISFLEVEEKPKRILEVHKLRYTDFEPKVPHEFAITKDGLKLMKTTVI